jgi:hypothetical protein
MPLIIFIGLTLPFSVIGLGLMTLYSLWLLFSGFPASWAIAVGAFCLVYMAIGYKLMRYLNNSGGVKDNATAAASAVPLVELLLAICFLGSSLPRQMSVWWTFLLPLSFILHLVLQMGFEVVLDSAHKAGRRK